MLFIRLIFLFRIEKLALDIVTSLEKDNARSVTLLCVLKGGFKFLGDLIAALESTIRARETVLPLSVDFIRIKSYVVSINNCTKFYCNLER